jgi:excisionase family DNA binding protein
MPTRKATKTKLTFTFSEAADQVGCSSKTISRMVASRQLKTVLLGKTPRIPAGELDRIGARK